MVRLHKKIFTASRVPQRSPHILGIHGRTEMIEHFNRLEWFINKNQIDNIKVLKRG